MKRAVIVILGFVFGLLSPGFFFIPEASAAVIECSCYNDTSGTSQSYSEEAPDCATLCERKGQFEESELSCLCKTEDGVTISAGGLAADCSLVCADVGATYEAPADGVPTIVESPTIPVLSVPIPGVSFSAPVATNDTINVNFIGQYINGVYSYLLGFAVTLAIIMVMIGGVQYILASGSGNIKKAQARIGNAVVGLVLLLFVTTILFTVNPQLTFFNSLNLVRVKEVALDLDTGGDEGVASISTGGTRLSELGEPCKTIVETAQSEGECKMTGDMFASPTGQNPNCGKHHWQDGGANGDYKKIKNLDYAASWDEKIRAPFSGTVSYQEQTDASNRCGNRIYLKGSGAEITICHAKDFTDDNGQYLGERKVKQGETIGHLGGNCCMGEVRPTGWSGGAGWCDVSGTPCTDPERRESCSCQPIEQAGNTSGPHVHVTWDLKGGDLLACLLDSGDITEEGGTSLP